MSSFCLINEVFIVSWMEWILCSFAWTAVRGRTFLIFLTPIQSISASFKEWLEHFPWFVKIMDFKVWPLMKITKILGRLLSKE